MNHKYIQLLQDKINLFFVSNVILDNEEEILNYLRNKPFNNSNFMNWLNFYICMREYGRMVATIKNSTTIKEDVFIDLPLVDGGNFKSNLNTTKGQDLIEIDINEDEGKRFQDAFNFKMFCGQDIGKVIYEKLKSLKLNLKNKFHNELEIREGKVEGKLYFV